MKTYFAYKIQNSDGMFSSGGSEPKFQRVGKVWNSIGALKSHLRLVSNQCGKSFYDNCIVVVLTNVGARPIPIEEGKI